MNSTYQKTLLKLIFAALVGLMLGAQLGNPWIGLSAALLLLIVSNLRNFQRFNRWMAAGPETPRPVLNSIWSDIRDQVVRIVRQHEKEEKRLRSDLDFFKDSFQALESAVLVVDSERQIDWANTAAQSMLGISYPRDSGVQLLNLLRGPALLKYLDSGDFAEPLQMISPRDAQRELEVQATVFRDDNMLIFVRDITAVAQLERVRQDFVANVSHELRTPLTVINGYLELLRENQQKLPESLMPVFDKMLDQSKRMGHLVNDLLWLSRLESMPPEEGGEALGFSGMWQGIIEDARISAPGVEIKLDVAPDIFAREGFDSSSLCIHGSYEELRAAFANLLQNAVKYTGEGGHIEVNCRRHLETFRVQVKDDGIGIDPVHLPRLTERFYRADDSRTSATGGTGLGLAIVKHVLKRHDATLEIASRPGKGSSFTCVFPLARVSPGLKPQGQTAASS